MRKDFIITVLFLLTGTMIFAGPEKIRIADDLYLEKISDNVWIHISEMDVPPWGKVAANGLVVKEKGFAVIIDTPWNDQQSEKLDTWIRENWGIPVKTVIGCHYHGDCLGGLGYFKGKGADSYSLQRTAEKCRETGLPVPENTFNGSLVLDYKPLKIELYFPGEGHTADSICVYIPSEKILFGGCSVKSKESRSLGNTVEANIKEWPASLREMKRRYSDARVVVPGHGDYGGLELIDHTLTLF